MTIRQIVPSYPFAFAISNLRYGLLANHWRWLDISFPTMWSSSQCRPVWYTLVVDVCASTLWLQCVIHLQLTLVVSDEVFADVVRRLHHIDEMCISVPLSDESKVIAPSNIMHDTIDREFSWYSSTLFCCILFSLFVDFVVSFPNGLVYRLFFMMLYDFWRWHHCSSVNQFVI